MKAAIYARVSTDEDRQNPDNQLNPLRTFAKSLGYEEQIEYVDYASGGNSNRPQFQAMMAAARKREFDIIFIWALDRFSREGILNTLSYLNTLKRHDVALKSYQEGWLDTREGGMGELLISIFAWIAEQEKKRISERVKAGLKSAKNVGKRGKDKGPRRKGGYFRRWDK